MAKRFSSFFRYVFIAFLGLIILVKAFYLTRILPDSIAITGIICIFISAILLLKYWNTIYRSISSGFKKKRLKNWQLAAILFFVSFITKAACIFIFRIDSIHIHPDIKIYAYSSYELTAFGKVEQNANYLLAFSHMFWFSVFLLPVTFVFGMSQTAYSVYMSLILTISIVLLYDTAAKRWGGYKAFFILLVFCLTPGQILLPQYITHEIAFLFFLSCSLWLYFSLLPRIKCSVPRVLTFLLSITALFIGTLVNSAGLVVCIAYAIVFIYELLVSKKIDAKKVLKAIAKISAIVLFLSVGTAGAATLQKEHTEYTGDSYFNKVLWTLFVGANTETDGMWSTDDVKLYSSYSSLLSKEEINAFRQKIVVERWTDLMKSPLRLLRHLWNKLTNIWSVFQYTIMYSHQTIPNKQILAFYKKYLDRPLIFLEYTVGLFASLIAFYENIQNRKKILSNIYLMVLLIIMGTTAMLMMAECHDKYLIPVHPLFLISAFALCESKKNAVETSATK